MQVSLKRHTKQHFDMKEVYKWVIKTDIKYQKWQFMVTLNINYNHDHELNIGHLSN